MPKANRSEVLKSSLMSDGIRRYPPHRSNAKASTSDGSSPTLNKSPSPYPSSAAWNTRSMDAFMGHSALTPPPSSLDLMPQTLSTKQSFTHPSDTTTSPLDDEVNSGPLSSMPMGEHTLWWTPAMWHADAQQPVAEDQSHPFPSTTLGAGISETGDNMPIALPHPLTPTSSRYIGLRKAPRCLMPYDEERAMRGLSGDNAYSLDDAVVASPVQLATLQSALSADGARQYATSGHATFIGSSTSLPSGMASSTDIPSCDTSAALKQSSGPLALSVVSGPSASQRVMSAPICYRLSIAPDWKIDPVQTNEAFVVKSQNDIVASQRKAGSYELEFVSSLGWELDALHAFATSSLWKEAVLKVHNRLISRYVNTTRHSITIGIDTQSALKSYVPQDFVKLPTGTARARRWDSRVFTPTFTRLPLGIVSTDVRWSSRVNVVGDGVSFGLPSMWVRSLHPDEAKRVVRTQSETELLLKIA